MKEYKRIEIPLGWKCNEKCFFCSEIDLINYHNGSSLEFSYFYKLLIKHYKQGYNHLTIVGGEPTIEKKFFKAIKLAKKLSMGVQISTNGIKFTNKLFTEEAMKYLDRITLSLHTLNDEKFKKITNTNIKGWFSMLEKICENLNNNFSNQSIRINCVLNKYNLDSEEIYKIIEFIDKNLNNYESIVLTYPDVTTIEDQNIINNIYIKGEDIKELLKNLENKITYKQKNKIILADMPFCFMPESFYNNSQDFFLDIKNISKISIKDKEEKLNREDVDPRGRIKKNICKSCKMEEKCFGFPQIFED